jgi:voltage-gated potassium channel
VLFTIEYVLRLISIQKPLRYVFSFLGIIDLLAIIPGYLSIFYVGAQSLLVVRSLRLLRVFRIFKLTHFLSEMQFLGVAIKGSLRKISIFMLIVLALGDHPWFGNVSCRKGRKRVHLYSGKYLLGYCYHHHCWLWRHIAGNAAGQSLSQLYYADWLWHYCGAHRHCNYRNGLAVKRREQTAEACPRCGREGHDKDAAFCKYCGGKL